REGFMGAYIHNAFSEDYEIVLKVSTDKTKHIGATAHLLPPTDMQSPVKAATPPPIAGTVIYQTEFTLPFIERYGLDRDDQNDAIIELGFSNPEEVVIAAAKLNGKDVAVNTYANAKNRAYKT